MIPDILKAHQSVVIRVFLLTLQTQKIFAMAFQMFVKSVGYAPAGIRRAIVQQLLGKNYEFPFKKKVTEMKRNNFFYTSFSDLLDESVSWPLRTGLRRKLLLK